MLAWCPMTQTGETVYSVGWRQGTVLRADIEVVATTLNVSSGESAASRYQHHIWALATQDCNLFRMRVNVNTPVIELRQVHDSDPPISQGIHARKFLLNDAEHHYLIDDKPSAFVSPRFLCDPHRVERMYYLGDSRVIAFKTWLGNRYDRPAVPTNLVPLAKAIAEAVKASEETELASKVRDVYMQFEDFDDAVKFSLYAITTDDAEEDSVREWLASCALEVPADLGVLAELEVATASNVSLELVESSYCADLSQLTWINEDSAN